MKRLYIFPLAVAALLFTGPTVSSAGSRIVATLTVTNNTETGDTLTSGSSIRTWTNTTTASTIATNAAGGDPTNVCYVATNLFSHLAQTYLPGPLVVQWSDTNAIKLIGQLDQSFSLLVTGAWATVTYTTQSFTKSWTVLWPIDAVAAQTNRTNQASDIIYGSKYSTNAFTATDTAVSNLVGLGNVQVIGGQKSWSGTNRFYGPVFATNLTLNNVTVTNGLVSYGVGVNSTILGPLTTAAGEAAVAIGYDNSADGTYSVAIGYGENTAGAPGAIAVGYNATSTGTNAIAYGYGSQALAENSIAIGTSTTASHSNSVTIGTGATSAAANEVRIGSASTPVYLGALQSPTVTNAYLRGTNRIEAAGYQSQTVATLADGANSISLLNTNASLIRFTGTLTANSSLNGVAGGWAGRLAICENITGYAITLANQSGLEGTPANRIVTGTGSDCTVPNGSYWTMIYDGAASRWDVVSLWPGAAIGLASMTMHDVTNRYVLAADTWLIITNWSHVKASTNVTASAATGTLTVGQAGWYNIRGHVSFAGLDVGGDNYEIGLFGGDGTVSLDCESYAAATSVDRANASTFTYAYLTNSEVLTLQINSEVGDDVDILGAQFGCELIRP